ncbi:MAG: PD40 domain-containing protein [Bacteroidales bacterium]|nr:PD40 domain-containing protein [Bacteroidales bacterium]
MTKNSWICNFTVLGIFFLQTGCNEKDPESYLRHDSASKLNIPVSGSMQNPAFSPDGRAIVFTQYRSGYNKGPADIMIINLKTGKLDTLVMDGSANVNLPGSSWNSQNKSIVFSSSRDPHDEIYIINDGGKPGDEMQITERSDYMAYEPTFSPDGAWIVFESHPVDVENQGVIMKYKLDHSTTYQALTNADDDCRQPNWSPAGDYILFQKYENSQWDIWIMSIDGSNKIKITSGAGDKTDACFTNDGKYIIYSCDSDLEFANIYKISTQGGNPERLTNYEGYDGAPSISFDGSKIAFESYGGDPDDSDGTSIFILEIEN